ncbi:hypothetical protein BaRGS_00020394 [Batillaria attramentaria]|uniref:RecA family profile 1 domain-containing protein n=1 Tax=Batillaria attramentaria TaxID=370345 RepID=A0ABD0KN22_9CAEN
MASNLTDEEYARILQAEFEEEEKKHRKQIMADAQMAASVAKAHEISDSDTDSDATVEPPDYCSPHDGSQDLFDSSTDRPSSSKGSRQNSSPHSASKLPLERKTSKIHEVSDSDSDGEKDNRPVKQIQVEKAPHCHRPAVSRDSTVVLSKKTTLSLSNGTTNRDSESDGCRSQKGGDDKPVCKYGDKCFRKNPSHFQEFSHKVNGKGKRKSTPTEDKEVLRKKIRKRDSGQTVEPETTRKSCGKVTSDFEKTVADVFSEFQPLSLFLTKVAGIEDRFNNTGAVSLKDILSPLMGTLEASCQFNFMFDIPWLVKQYPKQFRDKPMLLVHGDQGRSEAEMKTDAAQFPHISLCRAKLEMMYGTHHTKMMFLLYDCGMRVVIHTANLISNDWHQKTQGVWISPLFPKLTEGGNTSAGASVIGDSPTKFKRDLLAYVQAYQVVPLAAWERHIRQHNMSAASVYIVGSVPGRHSGDKKMLWGHMKVKKVLKEAGPEHQKVGSWPVIGQFSSIGSLGASMDQWLCDEWLGSLSQCRGNMGTPLSHSKLQLVYPSKENVRLCLEGYGGGGCLPYSIKTARKQIYLNNFVRQWRADGRGRTEAIPHIKTYTRVSPDCKEAAWFIVTSANLSKAAWGALEKQKTQLMIRSYEIGVLFLPRHFGELESFPVGPTAEEVRDSDNVMLPIPYDLPPPNYQKGDRIWMWDVPCVDLPDRHGKKYCPPLDALYPLSHRGPSALQFHETGRPGYEASFRSWSIIFVNVTVGLTRTVAVLNLSGAEVERLTGLTTSDVTQLRDAASEAVLRGKQQVTGGILARGITEIAGESAAGKTQLCLQLCLTAQLPVTQGGLEGGAVYICTEDVFPSKRLHQLVQHFSHKYTCTQYGNGHPLQFSDQIFVEHVADFDGLDMCLQKKLPLLLSRGMVKLVVVDSVAALFRCHYDNHHLVSRAKHLSSLAARLRRMSDQHSVAIVCVNQVSANMSGTPENISRSHQSLPALGLVWADNVTCRFLMIRPEHNALPAVLDTEQTGASGDLNSQIKSGAASVRQLEVMFAPHLPSLVLPLVITGAGVTCPR